MATLPRDIVKKILEAGIQAPSGENCQPWRFLIKDNQIHVFNIPERDESLYNFQQKGSFVAHGALIENILAASSFFGYEGSVNIFPEKNNFKLVAVISLTESRQQKDHKLYDAIFKRSTNRKPYTKGQLSEFEFRELLNSTQKINGGKLMLVSDTNKIKELAEAASMNEYVMFNNKYLHQFFFNHITWDEKEGREKRLGFYIKTLELPLPILLAFKLFRYWPIMRAFNKLGLYKFIAKANAQIYASSSAIGAIIVDNNDSENFVIAGRIVQRLWLKATEMGLSMQPLTGVLFFTQSIVSSEIPRFSEEQVNAIRNAYGRIEKVFGAEDKTIPMMFRIGRGDLPSASSFKLAPIIDYEV